jgi:hypothetical protein
VHPAENTATINQQKRKLSRQHDVLSSLKHKYAASDAKASEENSKLTDEYKRITEQFKDLQVRSSCSAGQTQVLQCVDSCDTGCARLASVVTRPAMQGASKGPPSPLRVLMLLLLI